MALRQVVRKEPTVTSRMAAGPGPGGYRMGLNLNLPVSTGATVLLLGTGLSKYPSQDYTQAKPPPSGQLEGH